MRDRKPAPVPAPPPSASDPGLASGQALEKKADTDGQLFKEAWQATLGMLGSAEEETQAILGRLMAFGRLSREECTRMYSDVRDLVEKRRNELEAQVQAAVQNAMRKFTVPSPQEVAEVAQKVAELERRVAALEDVEPRRAPRLPNPSTLARGISKAQARRPPRRRR